MGPDAASYIAEITGKTDISGESNGQEMGEEQGVAAQQSSEGASPGPALAVLLVQQLLQATLQEASQVLHWQNAELDALACQLAAAQLTYDSLGTSPEANQPATSDAAALADVAQHVANAALSDIGQDENDDKENEEEESLIASSDEGEQQGLPHSAVSPEANEEIAHASQYPTAVLLGLLVKGRDRMSLLSDDAVQQVFALLAQTLQAAAKQPSQGMQLRIKLCIHVSLRLPGMLHDASKLGFCQFMRTKCT